MPWFHKHTYQEFTCTVKDLGYPTLIKYGNLQVTTYGEKSWNYGECSYPSTIEILYKKCSSCEDVQIVLNDGSGKKIEFNFEYFKIIIEKYKKNKEDLEVERLLNIGNPDYKKMQEMEDTIKVLNETLEKTKKYAHNILEQLKESQKNDIIWSVIPLKVKNELYKKYEKKILNKKLEIKNELES